MSYWQRLARGVTLFRGQRTALLTAAGAVLVTAACEPLIPALLKPLLDRGFQGGDLKLWMVPVFVLALFAVRGMANFCAQYSLAYATNDAMKTLRRKLFAKLMTATPALFVAQTSSSLANTLVYEVQIGTSLLITALFSLVRDSLTSRCRHGLSSQRARAKPWAKMPHSRYLRKTWRTKARGVWW